MLKLELGSKRYEIFKKYLNLQQQIRKVKVGPYCNTVCPIWPGHGGLKEDSNIAGGRPGVCRSPAWPSRGGKTAIGREGGWSRSRGGGGLDSWRTGRKVSTADVIVVYEMHWKREEEEKYEEYEWLTFVGYEMRDAWYTCELGCVMGLANDLYNKHSVTLLFS